MNFQSLEDVCSQREEAALFWSHQLRAKERIFWEFYSVKTPVGLLEENKDTEFTITRLSAVAFG